jgi:8-oxo-dGTP diphosphatase
MEVIDSFYEYDPDILGSKGLVFIGDALLAYRRDEKTPLYPLHIDLPGGGPEPGETPFEVFTREVNEEFGLEIEPRHIVYVRRYPSLLSKGKYAYFPVAKLPPRAEKEIQFGHEGINHVLLTVDEFLALDDAWPILQERTADYLKSIRTSS